MSDTTIQNDIADALAGVIKAAQPNAIVWPVWTLSEPLGESIPSLRSPLETRWGPQNTPWVHSYMLDFEDGSRSRMGAGALDDDFTLRLWHYYGFLAPSAPQDYNNSYRVVNENVEIVKDALSAATNGQHPDLPGGVPKMKGHGEWQISTRGLYFFGKQKVHVVQGTITVQTYKIVPVTPLS